jgi:hypothetical protein
MARESAWRDYEKSQRASAAKTVEPPAPDEDAEYIKYLEEQVAAGVLEPKAVAFQKRRIEREKQILESTVKAQQAELTRRQHEVIETLDDVIEDLARPDLYGKGAGLDLIAKNGDDEGVATRNALAAAAGVDLEKDSPAVMRRKLKAAHKLLYGRVPAKSKEAEEPEAEPTAYPTLRPSNGVKPRIRPEDLEGMATVPPTARARKPVKGKAAAYKAVAEQMREGSPAESDYWEEDGLPE